MSNKLIQPTITVLKVRKYVTICTSMICGQDKKVNEKSV